MPQKIAKSYAISDAKITFVSLVDKAANKHEFLITKAADGQADFQSFGRIIKSDTESHYVTGIVYEPMVEDTDGNYMTEEEITKAAHWFMKNSGEADVQHCFQKADGVEVVESYVAKCGMEIEGQTIQKGTWLMTMEVTDADIWDSIEKGAITGFSMGGKGSYSTVDVDISDPNKPVVTKADTQKKGILKQLAKLFGMDVVEKGSVTKGAVRDSYNKRIVSDNFWTAYYTLSDYLLDQYNPATGRWEQVHDETVIREALEDFNEIIINLLADSDGVFKSIEKAGKSLSTKNKETLQGIHDSLGEFLSKFEEQEEDDVTKQEIQEIVKSAVQEAMTTITTAQNVTAVDPIQKAVAPAAEPQKEEPITKADIQKMIDAAIRKATGEEEPEEDEEPDIEGMVNKAVGEALAKFITGGNTTNLNGAGSEVHKSDESEHYLHGFI